jgi:Tfp pilus assembly protein PilF
MNRLVIYLLFVTSAFSCVDNKSSLEHFSEGVEYFRHEDYTSALMEFQKAFKKDASSLNTAFYKGLTESKLGQNQQALNSFQHAIDIDSNFYQTFIERAKLKIVLGDFVGACNDCDRAKFIKKDVPEIYKTKAIAFESMNDASNAIIGYEYAIKYGQNDGETFYKLGVLKLSNGNHEEACSLLSKAGELGYMEAYKTIKLNCNKANRNATKTEMVNSSSKNNQVIGQYRIYPKRYSVTFPSDWEVDELSNSNRSHLTVTAQKGGFFMTIIETEPKLTNPDFNAKSINEIDKEEFIEESRQKYTDFQLLNFNKMKINDVHAYYYKMSFSFYSTKLQQQLYGIHLMCVLLNPKTMKLYSILCNADKLEINNIEKQFKNTINTFKFE